MYLFGAGDDFVLIDTGGPDGTLGAGHLIESSRFRPRDCRLILLTHAHSGHAGNASGLRVLTGAPVVASAVAAEHLAAPVSARRGFLGRTTSPGRDAVAVDRILDMGETIDILGGIEVIDAPGHAAGSVVFHLRAIDALVVGDAATAAPGRPGPPPRAHCADPIAAGVTAEGLARRGARIVAPGHGWPTIEGAVPRRGDPAGR